MDFIGCDNFHCVVQYQEQWKISLVDFNIVKKIWMGSAVAFLEVVKLGMSQKQFGRFFGNLHWSSPRRAITLSRLKSQRFKIISIPKAKIPWHPLFTCPTRPLKSQLFDFLHQAMSSYPLFLSPQGFNPQVSREGRVPSMFQLFSEFMMIQQVLHK